MSRYNNNNEPNSTMNLEKYNRERLNTSEGIMTGGDVAIRISRINRSVDQRTNSKASFMSLKNQNNEKNVTEGKVGARVAELNRLAEPLQGSVAARIAAINQRIDLSRN